MVAHILSISTRWRWVVSFMLQLLYSQGKILWYLLDRQLGGPQSWSGCKSEEKNLITPSGNLNLVVQPIA
jgi:hypothetical protein